MKTIKNLLFLSLFFCSYLSYSQEISKFSKGCINDDCLLCYLSKSIDSDQAKNLFSYYKLKGEFPVWSNEKRGIKIETDINNDITEIIIFDIEAFNEILPMGLTSSSTVDGVIGQYGLLETDDYGGLWFDFNRAINVRVEFGEDRTLSNVRYSLEYGFSMSDECFENGLEEFSSVNGSDEYVSENETGEEDTDSEPPSDDSEQNTSPVDVDYNDQNPVQDKVYSETFESAFNKVILTAPKNFANADSYSFPDYGKGMVYSNEFYLFLEVYDNEEKAVARAKEFDEFLGKQKTPCCGITHELDAYSALIASVDIIRLPVYVAEGYDAALKNLRIVSTYRVDENTGKFHVLLILKNIEE